MKRTLSLMLVILSFAGSAFAVSADLTSGSPTGGPGATVKGGADATTATNAPTPLIKYSTGVFGQVNFAASANTSTGYVVFTRHLTGSKYFGTTNSLTNIYWKQAPKVADAAALRTAMPADCGTSTDPSVVFAPGAGWTSY